MTDEEILEKLSECFALACTLLILDHKFIKEKSINGYPAIITKWNHHAVFLKVPASGRTHI